MEVSEEVKNSVVVYMQTKLDSLKDREESLTHRHNVTLNEIRQERYLYTKLLQEACSHPKGELKRVPDWNHHKNEDDSYDECKICGKHL